MSATNPTYKPHNYLDVAVTVDIDAFKFVTHAGSICEGGALAAGVSEQSLLAGDNAAIISAGDALMKIKEALAKGDLVASNDVGWGVKATSGDFVNGIARMAGVTDVVIPIEVVKFKI